jgi:5,10-methylenetetrahydromethanopterin reductase
MYVSGTVAGCILKDGEAYDSPRVKAIAGPHATVALHSLVEQDEYREGWRQVPPALEPLVKRYREVYESYQPADARYLTNHRGHLMYLRPEEHEFATPELIRSTTWTATKAELRERVQEIKRAGYQHLGINAAYKQPELLDEWMELFASA